MYDIHYTYSPIHPSTHMVCIITLLPWLVSCDQLFSAVFFPSPIESLYLLYVPQNNALTRGKKDTLPWQSFSCLTNEPLTKATDFVPPSKED